MADHIFRLRRGTRYVDDNGATLLKADGTPERDDWGTYQTLNRHIKPYEGELVLEYEVNPNTGKKIPRLKIGDGINEFSALPYMSVDSFILPRQATTTIYDSKWLMVDNDDNFLDLFGNVIDEDGNILEEGRYNIDAEGNFVDEDGDIIKIRYAQRVTVANAVVTENSKIDLNPTPEMLVMFHEKDLTFVAENNNGVVFVYCVGQKPVNTYTIPVTITEIIVD